ncbi:MAG: AmmeMemoRadiSam system protein B [Spirochaetes bacterium]|jgi:hypothetical protein|nr:AmmeMemoRadiSam system protein B [Spirochaetota bacterium]
MWHRKAAFAGSFYPSDRKELSAMIDKYLDDAEKTRINGELVAVISPHAGYIYSGPIAAYSYAQLQGSGVELIVGIAPSHRARFEGASVIPEGIYETPLGALDIDSVAGGKLAGSDYFGFIKEAHQFEHSLEVQVPFLQRVLGKFSIAPIIIGTTDLDVCREVAKGISAALSSESRKYAIVISTDLSHYHSYNEAVNIDHRFMESLQSFDVENVYSACSSMGAEACGEGAVIAGMAASKLLGATGIEILKYGNSGDTAGGRDQVVGYLSAAIYK